jgi:fibronectin-binding autotransporter adhesin
MKIKTLATLAAAFLVLVTCVARSQSIPQTALYVADALGHLTAITAPTGPGTIIFPANGGTVLTTATGLTNPMSAAGQMIYGGALGVPTVLPIAGVNGAVLTYNTGTNIPGWASILAVANGGTGSSSQNWVDRTTAQASIGGAKTFTSLLTASAGATINGATNINNTATGAATNINATAGAAATAIGNTTNAGSLTNMTIGVSGPAAGNFTTIGITSQGTGAFTTASASTGVTAPLFQGSDATAGANTIFRAGNGTTSGGGSVSLLGGTATSGAGGGVTITGQNGITSGSGGAVAITAGNGVASTSAGGNITLTPGTTTGTGGAGAIVLSGPVSANGSVGSATQVLTSQGPGATPKWAAAGGSSFRVYTPATYSTGSLTLAVSDLIGGIITQTHNGNITFTTPTAAAIVAGIAGVTVGTGFEFILVQNGNNSLNLAAGAGVTIANGTAVNNGGGVGTYFLLVTATGTPAVTIYQIANN